MVLYKSYFQKLFALNASVINKSVTTPKATLEEIIHLLHLFIVSFRYLSIADNTKHAKDGDEEDWEVTENNHNSRKPQENSTNGSAGRRRRQQQQSLKGPFEEILQEHDEELAQVLQAHMFNFRHIWWSKLSHTQTAHSSTGQSTKFGFPLWLPLLQSFSAPLVPLWTVGDFSAQHRKLWMQGETG